MMKYLLLLVVFACNISHSQWLQKGSTFVGLDSNDAVGNSLCLDDLGETIAVGTVNNSSGGNVSVYNYDGSDWVIKGSAILQGNVTDSFGANISLNSVGSILAVAAPSSNPSGTSSGQVKIFEWDGFDWVQKGSNINGQSNSEYFGQALEISGDGLTVVVGVNGDTGTPGAGKCRVYEWNGVDDWVQKGLDIQGDSINDLFGFSVDINDAGDIVAVGGRGSDTNGNESGHVKVLRWNGSAWNLMGENINGEEDNDWSGYSVSLDSVGTLVAIGSRMHSSIYPEGGQVRMFEWTDTTWVQKGITLYGEGDFAQFGNNLKLNKRGDFLVVGSPNYDADSIGGRASIFYWDGLDWALVGSHIEMNHIYGWFGHSIDLADSGTKVLIAIGAPNTSMSGEVRVFGVGYKSSIDETVNSEFKMYPNPTNSSFWLEFPTNQSLINIHVSDVLGRLILTKEVEPGNMHCQLNFESEPGVYFVTIETPNGRSTQALVKE